MLYDNAIYWSTPNVVQTFDELWVAIRSSNSDNRTVFPLQAHSMHSPTVYSDSKTSKCPKCFDEQPRKKADLYTFMSSSILCFILFGICCEGTQEEAAAAYDMAAIEYRGANAVTNFDISSYADRLKTKALLPVPHDQDDHNQPLQQQNPNFSTQEDEGKEEEDKQLILVQPQVPPNLGYDIPTPNSIDSSEMEPDHPWDLCLDTSVFNALSVPDIIPLEKAGDLPPEYMFDSDYKSFEDNIDFMMFDVPTSNETTSDYFNPDSLFEITAGGFDMEADSFMDKEEEEAANGHRVSSTSPPPSSSSSTTTT